MNRIYAAIVATVVAGGLVGCTGEAESTPVSEQSQVIDHRGLPGIPFGVQRADLEDTHRLTEGPGDCAPVLPDHPDVSPVFDRNGRLVLVWVNPPLRTPEGIGVGSPVSAVHAAHPDAEPLPAPPETRQFDGLLVPVDDRAYLFLHDGTEVQKVIIGYTDYLRLLFEEGFGTC